MAFYDLTKIEREQKSKDIQDEILRGLDVNDDSTTIDYFGDTDTYIRKAAYLRVARVYKADQVDEQMRARVIRMLERLAANESAHVRQSVVNACGEIATSDFAQVAHIFESVLHDTRHEVKNAVQGALKKAGEKNPKEIIPFCEKYILHEDPEIRRQVLHGMELRGRKHPEDILPVLRLLEFETHKRVRPMLVHVMGQISYKQGCLEPVLKELYTWHDDELKRDCLGEIVRQNAHANDHLKTVRVIFVDECAKTIQKYFGNTYEG